MKFQIDFRPDQVDQTVFRAEGAVVLGDVTIGRESSIWFHAVVRGDTEAVRIGCQTNIQDHCVLHADPGFPCTIGDRVTAGHGAIIHGATIEDDVLVGMRAVILNGAVVGRGSLVAAGAIVTEGLQIPPGSIVAGTPAKIRGQVSPRHEEMIRHGAEHYVLAGQAYRNANS
ncbi:gamma carbonic anhydrase family protein [Rhodopirellula sp. MGV]|uniref:gamma carbonic anhydrase family protein n=1 Tax=Rhodopirellula sp. MGV TaxID=2023130 RepID=UPI000B967B14|nr:gamma carbonic anhydrase family protein [Rhodopirellula sp. MGV]OYP35207.1 gamma carbonic anhydrase family protein [Rhodopirellula sp. MGV]PNY37778.1 gamma carbonic anhydrase family protein [Rhodopirellula baltica]